MDSQINLVCRKIVSVIGQKNKQAIIPPSLDVVLSYYESVLMRYLFGTLDKEQVLRALLHIHRFIKEADDSTSSTAFSGVKTLTLPQRKTEKQSFINRMIRRTWYTTTVLKIGYYGVVYFRIKSITDTALHLSNVVKTEGGMLFLTLILGGTLKKTAANYFAQNLTQALNTTNTSQVALYEPLQEVITAFRGFQPSVADMNFLLEEYNKENPVVSYMKEVLPVSLVSSFPPVDQQTGMVYEKFSFFSNALNHVIRPRADIPYSSKTLTGISLRNTIGEYTLSISEYARKLPWIGESLPYDVIIDPISAVSKASGLDPWAKVNIAALQNKFDLLDTEIGNAYRSFATAADTLVTPAHELYQGFFYLFDNLYIILLLICILIAFDYFTFHGSTVDWFSDLLPCLQSTGCCGSDSVEEDEKHDGPVDEDRMQIELVRKNLERDLTYLHTQELTFEEWNRAIQSENEWEIEEDNESDF